MRNTVRHAIGPYISRRYGQITRSTGVPKIILQGSVHGGRRKSWQNKRWENNFKKIISAWTGLGLGEALRKAEDREEWRKVVARSSLMPQRSFRPRDVSELVARDGPEP